MSYKKYKVVDQERFLACISVILILLGLYITIGTIECRIGMQLENMVMMQL